jgi:hypothetical protein
MQKSIIGVIRPTEIFLGVWFLLILIYLFEVILKKNDSENFMDFNAD